MICQGNTESISREKSRSLKIMAMVVFVRKNNPCTYNHPHFRLLYFTFSSDKEYNQLGYRGK